MAAQGPLFYWVANHRRHHHFSDRPGDPHSPRQNFFWSHMGWFLIYDPAIYSITTYDHYARDLFQDRFYKWLERPRVWRTIHALQWAAFLAAGVLWIIATASGRYAAFSAQGGMIIILWLASILTSAVAHTLDVWRYLVPSTPMVALMLSLSGVELAKAIGVYRRQLPDP